jgi:epoxyqueuosine reductase
MTVADFSALDRAGLNLQAVFDLEALPEKMAMEFRRHFDPRGRYRQLILFGHGGKAMWDAMQATGIRSDDPIDDFSVSQVERWFAEQFAGRNFLMVYPGDTPVGLQSLGRLAGWHHASPFMVGVNETWGTWYAYRVVMLADTAIEPTLPIPGESPCVSCVGRPCVSACLGRSMNEGAFSLEKCIAYRRLPSSRCKTTCVARTSCPVGSEHRYGDAQMTHCYSISMRMIERYY